MKKIFCLLLGGYLASQFNCLEATAYEHKNDEKPTHRSVSHSKHSKTTDANISHDIYVNVNLAGTYMREDKASITTQANYIAAGGANDIKTYVDKLDGSVDFGIAASLGYDLTEHYMIEANIGYVKLETQILNNPIKNIFFDMTALDTYVNVIGTLANREDIFRPFVGAGIGLTSRYVDFTNYSYGDQLTFGGLQGDWQKSLKSNAASSSDFKTEWKSTLGGQIIAGSNIRLVKDQIDAVLKVTLNNLFKNSKMSQSSDDSINIKYKSWRLIFSTGLQINF